MVNRTGTYQGEWKNGNGIVKESISSLTAVYIKVILRMVTDVAMEYSSGQIKLPMKDNGRMDICMGKESITSQMAEYMKVTGKMVTNVAMEYRSGHPELATKGNGRMTKGTE